MPKVSEFFGISIYFYYDDHNPPHFHARYAGTEAVFEIDTLDVLAGEVSPRVRGLVTEWAEQNRAELIMNWDRARTHESLLPIEPLV